MERLRPYDDHVITQVATGLFGVREETIQRVPIVEFKYAQGAKPGLGGHLLGDKNTISVSRMREAVRGISLFSPFPFHSVYSIEDHMKHIDWIKHVNRRALISTPVPPPASPQNGKTRTWTAEAPPFRFQYRTRRRRRPAARVVRFAARSRR